MLGPRLLAPGDLLAAAIQSREDHGYIMDVGSQTVRGFVTSKAMAKLQQPPSVGQVVWAVVTRSEPGVVTLNPAPAKVRQEAWSR